MISNVIEFAHQLISAAAGPGDTVVDATVGKGKDTAFLRTCVGTRGFVYGFDIQTAAIEAATAYLNRQFDETANIQLFCTDHARLLEVLPATCQHKISAVTYNLGYLPGSEHHVITHPDSTIASLEAALVLLKPGGVATIAVYTGHTGGPQEAASVQAWAGRLPQKAYHVMQTEFTNQKRNPPFLITIYKR